MQTEVILSIVIALAIVLVVIGFTLLISFVVLKSKKLDSKERFIHSLLPELDCEKCGCGNCEQFAKEVAEEKRDISECPYILKANLSKAERIIKKGYVNNSNYIACVLCKGGKNCKDKYDYIGQEYCWTKDNLYSGHKACDHACLGCGDCIRACRYNAIFINENGVAEIDRTKCTGCGACTEACPNKLIVRIPANQSVNVLCSNFKEKVAIKNKCTVGCTGCGMCQKVCPADAITLEDGKPVIDPEKCIHCNKCIGACPNGTISRL